MSCLWRQITRPVVPFLIMKHSRLNLARNFIYQHNVNSTSVLTSLQENNIYYNIIRSKSKKAKYDSDDEDEGQILDDDSSLSRDSKVVKLNTTSLRTDLILKAALGIARNKIEQHFYESKIRVNGKKVMKKSTSVKIGDEIDIIKMVSPKNPDHLYVYRVEVLDVAVNDDAIVVTARRFKNLLIENYEEDSFKRQVESDT